MIVDSSATIAILMREPNAERYEAALLTAPRSAMSTATYVEVIIVIDRKAGAGMLALADEFVEAAQIELVPFTVEQAQWARHARLTHGAGRHPANLNLGDCFFLRTGQDRRRTAAVQGRRLRPHGHRGGALTAGLQRPARPQSLGGN